MSDNQEWTVGKLLAWTSDYLKKQGADNPRLDAELLLAHARGCERIMLYTCFGEVVADDIRGQFRELVKRRAAGEPVAYLVGRKEFYSLSFKVTADVLIPRPETESLVVAVLDRLKERGADAPPAQIVDVGTGSGAIAVSLAKHAPSAVICATDISPAALAIAQENAATHGVADRIRFTTGDLLATFPPQPQFDIVVSNPPYIGERERPTLSKQVVDFEPAVALFGGETGTETIARLIDEAAERLLPGGWLIFELSPIIEADVRQLLTADERWQDVAIAKDYGGLARVAQARRRT